ncbi:MAG: hypothetical protein H6Q73_3692 [Firmicutes bacterium]|nr:hypothetical protein [Bacillota bacterium]
MLNKLLNFIINNSITCYDSMTYFHYVRAVAAVEREAESVAENDCTTSHKKAA